MSICRLAILLSVLSLPIYGEIYKWVDSDGKVHYGDKGKEDAEKVTLKPESVSAYDKNTKDQLDKNAKWFAEQQSRREEEEARKKKQENKDAKVAVKKNEGCQRHKNSLINTEKELQARKRAGITPKRESWYKTRIATLKARVEQNC